MFVINNDLRLYLWIVSAKIGNCNRSLPIVRSFSEILPKTRHNSGLEASLIVLIDLVISSVLEITEKPLYLFVGKSYLKVNN